MWQSASELGFVDSVGRPKLISTQVNATVMAYGQTGTGKTFTMLGAPAAPEAGQLPGDTTIASTPQVLKDLPSASGKCVMASATLNSRHLSMAPTVPIWG